MQHNVFQTNFIIKNVRILHLKEFKILFNRMK